MIKNKLIQLRKAKYTQENMAKLLHMTQSQYQRREKGDIKISDEEWERIAKVLDTPIEGIKEEDSTIHQINNYRNYLSDYILENQQDYKNLLKKEIQDLREILAALKS